MTKKRSNGRTVSAASRQPSMPHSLRKKKQVESLYDRLRDTAEYSDMSVPSLPRQGERKRVIVLRGLPGSGKSTWAELVMRAYPEGTVARLNNDDVSHLMFGSSYVEDAEDMPRLLTDIRLGMLRSLLQSRSVRMVIVDNTNLASRTVAQLDTVSTLMGAEFIVDDRFLYVPVEECLRRNSLRDDSKVPADAIRRMSRTALALHPWKTRSAALRQYDNSDRSLPEVTLVDLDRTLAWKSPLRGPYDWAKVGLDDADPAMVAMVRGLRADGHDVIVFSARDGAALAESRKWVARHIGEGIRVIHKGTGDNRAAAIVKPEMAYRELEGRYRIACLVDDDKDVVAAFRTMGLKVWHVDSEGR